ETVEPGIDIRKQYPWLSPTEHALMGFWLDRANTGPSYTPAKWYAEYRHRYRGAFWDKARYRIADQVAYIRHWKIENADFTAGASLRDTTIFLDPPYQHHGSGYRRS